ncbi:uncharacterized protein LOC127136906 [Lathyrus oleraceus]|uniref:uncharacterized protein LOC127136906 n=1 Tax=Pisum sativum TaxID=3888 RepID=UPI0021D17D02|nr:uncharacterized protein LOC127136906 [Pisum sativum]
MLNEPISPISSSPSSPPYYILSYDSEPSDPQSPTLAQLHARALASQQQLEPEANTPPPEQLTQPPSEQPQNPPPEQPTTPPFETTIVPPIEKIITPTSQPPAGTTQTPPTSPSPNSKPENTSPLEEATSLFAESSVEKIRSLSENSGINDDPSAVRIHWNRVIRCMTYGAFKLKSLSEQVRNDFIREAGERLQARLVREVEEKARREAEEKARLEEEQWVREAVEKAVVAATVEAEAKAKADTEEAAYIAAEEAAKARTDALAQGEQSNFGFAPLVLKTLEELQKEQQIVRARLDHQDSVNNNIQNLLTQLL